MLSANINNILNYFNKHDKVQMQQLLLELLLNTLRKMPWIYMTTYKVTFNKNYSFSGEDYILYYLKV